MYRSLVLLTNILLCLATSAQSDFKITKGKVESDSKWNYVNTVFGQDSGGYYTLSDAKFRVRIEKYDPGFNKLLSVKLELSDDQYKDRESKNIFFYNDKIYVVSSAHQKSDKSISYFIETLDKNTLLSNKDVNKICEFKTDSKENYDTVTHSEDASKILIAQISFTDQAVYNICVLNTGSIKPEFVKELTFPKGLDHSFVDCFISDGGITVIYEHTYEPSAEQAEYIKEVKKNSPDFDPHSAMKYKSSLILLSPTGTEQQNASIDLGDKQAGALRINQTKAGDIICAGFYTNDTIGRVNGVFFSKINSKTLKVETTKNNALPFSASGFGINHLFMLSDGSTIMLAEASNHIHRVIEGQLWKGQHLTVSDYQNPHVNTHSSIYKDRKDMDTKTNSFYHGNIIVAAFSPDGGMKWNKVIRKNQAFTVPGEYGFAYFMYASYAAVVVNEKIHVLYNDHQQNYNQTNEKLAVFERNVSAFLVDASISTTDGNVTNRIISKSQEDKMLFRPLGALQVNSDELVMFGSKEDDHQGMRIKFQD